MKRRKFLTYTSSISAGLLSAPLISCGPKQSVGSSAKEKLGVALVGLGYYSTDLLAPALQLTKHCELRGIVTGSPAKVPIWQEKYGISDTHVYNYENMHEIADNDDIDVVYIVVPTGLHAKVCSDSCGRRQACMVRETYGFGCSTVPVHHKLMCFK